MSTADSTALGAADLDSLFSDLSNLPSVVLAVSGGPDSTALMLLAARWREGLKRGPELVAVTVDHRLRKESKHEAEAVKKLARKLGVQHMTLTWNGRKPKAGLPAAAREARYALLTTAAKKAGATHILTAHTLDDQAETVLFRMARGSGVKGLAAMARKSQRDGVVLHRPLLGIAKARLIATLRAAKIPFADDPTNRDTAFTRPRLRALLPALAKEGLDARRLALLAQRLRRADAALEAAADRAMADVALSGDEKSTAFDARAFQRLPAEIALRVLGRAVTRLGDEGPVELGKLESLKAAIDQAAKSGAKADFRRTLAGAIVALSDGRLTVARAPARRSRKALTTRGRGKAARGKRR